MWIDIVFLVVLLYGFWQGWSQGIVGTILNLAIYAFGLIMAFKMAPVTSALLEKLFDSTHPLMFVGGFAANMLLIYLLVHLATNNIEEALNRAYLGTINRLIGAGVIATFYVLLFSVLIWFFVQANGIGPKTMAESKTYPFLQPLPGYAKSIAIRFQPMAADSWTDFNTWLDKARQFGIEETSGKAKVYELPLPDKSEPLFKSEPEKSKPIKDSSPIE
jgi:membrane protein required for colicin V production